MIILTYSRNGFVCDFGERIEFPNEQFVMIVGSDTAYPVKETNIYEVESVPEDIKDGSYVYNPDKGFYHFAGAYGIPDDLVEQIKNDTITEIQQEVTSHANE